MLLAEPMTTLTDYALAALALGLAIRLRLHGNRGGQRSVQLLAATLLATAVAAAAGGTSHGFRPWLPSVANALLWKLTVLTIGATALLLLVSTVTATLGKRGRRALVAIGLAQFALYAAWMARHDAFIWVIANYAPQILVALALHLWAWRRGVAGSGWIAGGIAVTLAGSAIQVSGFAIHPAFNHNDLFHVIQMVGTALLFRGGLDLRDHNGDAPGGEAA